LNRFDLWRYFGFLPEAPESAYTGNPDQTISDLNGIAENITTLFSLALRFSRLDTLKGILSADDWEDSAEGLLNRGRLRFFQALAEKPDSPEIDILNEAAVDFRRAADFPGVYLEALAGLVRFHALIDGLPAAIKHLRGLERLGGFFWNPAAAGAWIFLSEHRGLDEKSRRRFLKRARRQLLGKAQLGENNEISLLLIEIDYQLGNLKNAGKRLETLSSRGLMEARLILIQDRILQWQQNDYESRDRLFSEISEYKKLRPSDPRGFIAEGDLLFPGDPETAHMAWRTALVLDDRSTEAWMRIGNLYRENNLDIWLEAAEDTFLKAVSLNPLNSSYRLALGIVEQVFGRSAQALSTFYGALALVHDDVTIRRRIAMCWNNLALSPDLSFPARSAAAGRARVEWERLLGDKRQPADLLGLLQSLACELIGEPEKIEELSPIISELTEELIQVNIPEDPEDLINLAEDFFQAGLRKEAGVLLESVSHVFPEYPGLKAAWGLLAGVLNPLESMDLFLAAASAISPEDSRYVYWIFRASDMAASAGCYTDEESILRTGLIHHPENLSLLKRLSEKLADENRTEEALSLYQDSLGKNNKNSDLLEEAVWFFRFVGHSFLAETTLNNAITDNPDNGWLWNQLGVHFMEIGWDESLGSMIQESLESAIYAYRRAVDMIPENTVFMGNLGDALRQMGKFSEAWDLLKRAVEGGSDSSEDAFVLNSLARLEDERSYTGEGSDSSVSDWAESGKHYRIAAENGSGNSDFQRDYAWWLSRERRLEEAIDYYHRAGVIDPSDETLPYSESICFLELGNEKAALESLDRALMIKPADPGMLVDKADLSGALGDTAAGERCYREVLLKTDQAVWVWERFGEFCTLRAEEAEPSYSDPFIVLDGIALFPAEDLLFQPRSAEGDKWRNQALSAWEEAWHLEPDNKKIRMKYAAALTALGNVQLAEDLLERVVGDHQSLNLLGKLELYRSFRLADTGLRFSAKDHLLAAVKINPEVSSYHAGLGYWYYLELQWEKALEAFRQAADRAAQNPEYAGNTGICAYAAGSYKEAVAYLTRALTLGENRAEWQNALGLSLMASGSIEQALGAFQSACLADPYNNIFTANLAMAHESLHTPSLTVQ